MFPARRLLISFLPVFVLLFVFACQQDGERLEFENSELVDEDLQEPVAAFERQARPEQSGEEVVEEPEELTLAPATQPPPVIGTVEAVDENPDPGIVEVTLVAFPMEVEVLPGTTTVLWTYNGVFPGPMIRATVGDTLIVHFENQLPESSTIHWHGMRVPNNMDGAPLVQDPVEAGGSFTYEFVIPDAGTYWYHPHVRTNEQVERGLYGALIVHEAQPPAYDAERVLVLDDIRLEEDGSRAPFLDIMPDLMHGRHGNLLLVNGKAGDITEEISLRPGTVERWRILNSANARFAVLEFPGLEWRVIALDGGLIQEPFTPDRLVVSPGERYDVEVRLAEDFGTVQAALDYFVPMLDGEEVVYMPYTLFQVASDGQIPLERREVALPEVHMPDWLESTEHIEVELDGGHVASGIKWFLNGKAWGEHTPFEVSLDSTYTIDFVNKSFIDHPMHIHGHFFEVIYPEGAYPGLKDTVIVPGESTVRIKMRFDNPGAWMYHCHILEHAKVGMKSVINVK